MLLTGAAAICDFFCSCGNGHEMILYLLVTYGTFAYVVGLTLNTPGDLAISLGTSDTVS